MKRSHLLLILAGLLVVTATAAVAVMVWLVLTAPSAVAGAIDGRELMPLVHMVVGTLWRVLLAVVGYAVRL